MISRTAEYALRVVVYLASEGGGPLSRRTMAESIHVPSEYLTKVLRGMEHAGLINAKRGPGGGYSLELSPAEVSIYDVVTAVSTLPRISSCPLGLPEHLELCPLHKKLNEATEHVEKAFKSTTIEELTTKRRKKSSCRFPKK